MPELGLAPSLRPVAGAACRPGAVNYILTVDNCEVPMRVSEARIPTAAASRYLQQLCKHWSHKFAVEFSPEKGRIPFAADRRCLLEAAPDHLALRIEAADEASLERMESVVADHLKRFAFREELGGIAWQRS
jgi:uncharacterized protein